MIKAININSKKIEKFLNDIDEDFAVNKSKKNTPWKYFNLKNFFFYYFIFKKKIIGSIVISNHRNNIHINFLYVLKKYRSKKIGSHLIKFIEKQSKKKIISVHVFKYAGKVKIFYKKNGFQEFNSYKKLDEFILKARKFNKNVYKEKKLFYKTNIS
jgi:ribosomal protein S18 acetylase RimI-like enzyme